MSLVFLWYVTEIYHSSKIENPLSTTIDKEMFCAKICATLNLHNEKHSRRGLL